MASGKKKRGSTLIILLLVMIVMIGACFWLIKYKDKQAAEKTEESKEENVIATVKSDDIQSIYFKCPDGEMTLVRGDKDVWKNSDDEAFPVNQSYVSAMLTGLSSITSNRTITEGLDKLSTFGLETPSIQVTATTKDGKKTEIAMGGKAPLNSGYYAILNGDNKKVYTVPEAFYSYFNHSVAQMADIEKLPEINAQYVTYLKVENKENPTFEVSFDENKPADYASFTNWTMKQPYATNVPADSEALTTLFANYAAMSFSSCVSYKADDLSKYGLDKPTATVSLKYYEVYQKEKNSSDTSDTTDTSKTADNNKTKINHDLTLLFGSKDDNGNYYAKTSDSNAVYTMSADAVDKIIKVDAFTNVYKYINLVNIKDIDKLDIIAEGKTDTLSIEKAKESDNKDTKDSSEEEDKYFVNGKQVKKNVFTDLYQVIIVPKAERNLPADYSASASKGKTSLLTLKFHFIAGNTVTINYIPYDDSYCVVDSDGVRNFLADIRNINDVIAKVKDFKAE